MKLSERYELIQKIARYRTDRVDMQDLLDSYYNSKCEYLNELDDSELLEELEELDEVRHEYHKLLSKGY